MPKPNDKAVEITGMSFLGTTAPITVTAAYEHQDLIRVGFTWLAKTRYRLIPVKTVEAVIGLLSRAVCEYRARRPFGQR